ncbi:polysaccharide deacetylase family protein [Brassicibacter mesophilus]|uniref:polysaccharide deacetylase family protein n=1 Tax=Brassicibacter mesophilus TaxID=745119 RepID=UPI003D1BB670
MKIIYIRYKSLLIVVLIVFVILLISSLLFLKMGNRSQETFFNDDVFYKGNVDDNIIAFTCNVDWGNEYIPTMLEIFKKNDIKITFFVTGRWADKNSELLKQIYDNGHEIGNHGYTHRDYDKLSYEQNKSEILRADQVISQTLKYKAKYFAPPSGAYNDSTVRAAKELGYNVIMWSIDTIDWRKDSTKDKIINRVITKPHNSAIVLMHPKEETIKALPTIIQSLTEKGYKIGCVSDIVK